MYASTLIRHILRTSRSRVDIIELGPLTNLAHVLQEEPLLYKKKVRRLYMSGGDIVARNVTGSTKVWPYSSEPNGTSFTGKPAGPAWNVFSDPIAANSVFSFGVPIVFGSTPFQKAIPFNTTDTTFIPSSCPAHIAKILREMILQLPAANNEKGAEEKRLKYWDQSLAVLAVQMIRHHGAEQAAVCTKWDKKRFAVMMEASNNATLGGHRYAMLLENTFGKLAVECLDSNVTEFKTAFYAGICGAFHEAP
eukprot:Skav205034  [mRNA]  locus=scaffold2669:115145:115894:- [translate_table: standard]